MRNVIFLIFLFINSNIYAFDLNVSNSFLDSMGMFPLVLDGSVRPCETLINYKTCTVSGDMLTVVFDINFSLINASGTIMIDGLIVDSSNISSIIIDSVEYTNSFSFSLLNNNSKNIELKLVIPYKGPTSINTFPTIEIPLEVYYDN